MTDTAKQYALAVFSLASEKNKIKDFSISLKAFVDGLNDEIEKFFRHPKISKLQKKDTIDKTVKDQLLCDFLKVLIDNNRFDLTESIYYAYKDLLNNMDKIMEVTVFSNKKLTKANIERIKTKIEKNYQRKVKIFEIVDETIIGGIKIEYEGKVIDNTINSYLQNLKSALKE